MTVQTQEERDEMLECSNVFKENAAAYEESAKDVKNKKIKDRMESVAMSFKINAKILEAYARSLDPEKDIYKKIFPDYQKG